MRGCSNYVPMLLSVVSILESEMKCNLYLNTNYEFLAATYWTGYGMHDSEPHVNASRKLLWRVWALRRAFPITITRPLSGQAMSSPRCGFAFPTSNCPALTQPYTIAPALKLRTWADKRCVFCYTLQTRPDVHSYAEEDRCSGGVRVSFELSLNPLRIVSSTGWMNLYQKQRLKHNSLTMASSIKRLLLV